MEFPKRYKCLDIQITQFNEYALVPIRYEDRLAIRIWRNQQMYHLRQDSILSLEAQDEYFNTTVAEIFDSPLPKQLLFSFLKNDALIGYGGLVHINWVDKHAEISFLIDTELEKDNFDEFWCEYIKLIEQIAFKELKLHKIYVYAFDLRPHLYLSLLKSNFFKDSQLKDHVLINGSFIDVVIHSKINSKL